MKRNITINLHTIILILLTILLTTFLVACHKEEEVKTEPIVTEPVEEEIEEEPVKEEEPEQVIEVDEHEGMAINPLTGLYINEDVINRRPIGVMISNIEYALPQSGISQADIIYETLAEGGIPRLFAVFKDFDATKIGPVRSARHYFLDFSFDFDAIYTHYGKSPQAQQAFYDLNAPHMDGLSGYESIMCYQDETRVRPHATYTSYEGLIAGLEYNGYRTEVNSDFDNKLNFSEEEYVLENENIAEYVELPFSYCHYPWFEFNKEDSLYYRFQYGEKQIDVETSEQVKFKNIIIQIANMWVIPGDSEGRLDMSLVSSGDGYYVTNGKYVPITWEKESHYEPTHYYLEDGSELILNPGKTWISVFPSYNSEGIKFEKLD